MKQEATTRAERRAETRAELAKLKSQSQAREAARKAEAAAAQAEAKALREVQRREYLVAERALRSFLSGKPLIPPFNGWMYSDGSTLAENQAELDRLLAEAAEALAIRKSLNPETGPPIQGSGTGQKES